MTANRGFWSDRSDRPEAAYLADHHITSVVGTEEDDFDFAAGFGDASMLPSMAYVMTGLPRQHP